MSGARSMMKDIWRALGGSDEQAGLLQETGRGDLASAFAVSDFAAATTGAAALAMAEFILARGGQCAGGSVDRRLASLWFMKSVRPVGWRLPSPWDPIAGNYRAQDGWIRLHTNAPHHRAAALAVLGVEPDTNAVAEAVGRWSAQILEDAVIDAGGVAGMMRPLEAWRNHPQGRAVATEPLVAWRENGRRVLRDFGRDGRPLEGLRVLDLTRVLAGPVGTRFLAGFGADVLRIDPPFWDEPAVLPEVTPGKTRARLDLRQYKDREAFARLLAEADVLVHGYRSDALERIGFGQAERGRLAPGLIDVALNAYGWTGPWARRRGFDTVVQMSTGLAAREQAARNSAVPVQLPVQALDFGTGHLVAAAVLRALTQQARDGSGCMARLSLARSAAFLAAHETVEAEPMAPESDADLAEEMEQTHWGAVRRLKPPFSVEGCSFGWTRTAGPLGDGQAAFQLAQSRNR